MKNKIIASFCILFCALLLTVVYYVNRKVDRIVVVDVLQVVNEFKLKKDLEKRVEPALYEYANRADSLEALYKNRLEAGDDKAATDALETGYVAAQNNLDEIYTRTNKKINEQVWHRLNTLIDEYAEVKGYRLIVGANGMGTVLYNDDDIDCTKDLILFINSRYERGK